LGEGRGGELVEGNLVESLRGVSKRGRNRAVGAGANRKKAQKGGVEYASELIKGPRMIKRDHVNEGRREPNPQTHPQRRETSEKG